MGLYISESSAGYGLEYAKPPYIATGSVQDTVNIVLIFLRFSKKQDKLIIYIYVFKIKDKL
jgi:hypothetical protein